MMEPVAKGPVSNLIVILEKEDKPARRNALGVGAARLAKIAGMLAAIKPTLFRCHSDVLRRTCKVFKIAIVVPRQAPAHLVMKIVRPGRVQSPAALCYWLDHPGLIPNVFRNHENSAGATPE